MTYVPERWNVCATCKWWRGRRQVKFIAAGAPPQVVVDGIMPGGSTCVVWNRDRSAMGRCDHWLKWERL